MAMPQPPTSVRRRTNATKTPDTANKIADLSGFNPYARRAGVTGPPRIGSTPHDASVTSSVKHQRRRGDYADVEASTHRRLHTSDSDIDDSGGPRRSGSGCSTYSGGRGSTGSLGAGSTGRSLHFDSSDGESSRRRSSAWLDADGGESGWGGWRGFLGTRTCTAVLVITTLTLLLGVATAVYGMIMRNGSA